jgi:D-sedoheptulose 7-phosphate isomerase
MKQQILYSALECVRASNVLLQECSIDFIDKASSMIVECYEKSGKILIAGNGGSLCDAMHFAEELTGFYREKRKPLAAIALSDPGHITCVGNDVGYEDVSARSVQALAREEDILIVLTTSGNSKNLIKAVELAKQIGIKTIAFLGKEGGALKGESTLEWIVSSFKYSDRVQEAHMAAIHIIIEMIEKKLEQKELMISKPALSLKALYEK